MRVECLILPHIPGRNVNRNRYFGKQFVMSTKINICLPYNPVSLPKRNERLYLPKDIHVGGLFTIVLLLIASEWKLPKRPPRVEWINALLYFHTME